MKGYLATHFFNEAGFKYTKELAELIRKEVPELNLYVPQENSEINDKSNNDGVITSELIAKGDNHYLKHSNILIANLDGVEIDSGVSAEIGYFSGLIEAEKDLLDEPKERIIIGLYTDIRQDGTGENFFYINLYTKGLVKLNGIIVKNKFELVEEIKKFVRFA